MLKPVRLRIRSYGLRSGELVLSNTQKAELQLRVLDAAGREVTTRMYAVEETFNTTVVFDRQLSAGVYMVEMTNAGSVQTHRLIVQ